MEHLTYRRITKALGAWMVFVVFGCGHAGNEAPANISPGGKAERHSNDPIKVEAIQVLTHCRLVERLVECEANPDFSMFPDAPPNMRTFPFGDQIMVGVRLAGFPSLPIKRLVNDETDKVQWYIPLPEGVEERDMFPIKFDVTVIAYWGREQVINSTTLEFGPELNDGVEITAPFEIWPLDLVWGDPEASSLVKQLGGKVSFKFLLEQEQWGTFRYDAPAKLQTSSPTRLWFPVAKGNKLRIRLSRFVGDLKTGIFPQRMTTFALGDEWSVCEKPGYYVVNPSTGELSPGEDPPATTN